MFSQVSVCLQGWGALVPCPFQGGYIWPHVLSRVGISGPMSFPGGEYVQGWLGMSRRVYPGRLGMSRCLGRVETYLRGYVRPRTYPLCSASGRYAFYWNAFMLENCILSESLWAFFIGAEEFCEGFERNSPTIYTQEKLTFWQNYTNLKFERYLII